MFSVAKGGQIVLKTTWTENDFGAMIMGTPIELSDDDLAVLKECYMSGKIVYIVMPTTGNVSDVVAPVVIPGASFDSDGNMSELRMVMYTWATGIGTAICLRANYVNKTLSYDATP